MTNQEALKRLAVLFKIKSSDPEEIVEEIEGQWDALKEERDRLERKLWDVESALS